MPPSSIVIFHQTSDGATRSSAVLRCFHDIIQPGTRRTLITCALYLQAPTTTSTNTNYPAWVRQRPLRIKRRRNNNNNNSNKDDNNNNIWNNTVCCGAAGDAVWRCHWICCPTLANSANKVSAAAAPLHISGIIRTLHYTLSKGAMKCVRHFVCVHVPACGISDEQCRYKASANECCPDNYGLAGPSGPPMKRRLCVLWVDVALWPLLLSVACVWPGLFVSPRIRACTSVARSALEAQRSAPAPLPPFHIASPPAADEPPNWSSFCQWICWLAEFWGLGEQDPNWSVYILL